ncbi:MAG: sodium:proton antiporter [Clostridia bacterium]|jgi:Kef-type K+ transport system membrane component KefB|nr:sodium:proton antiporter [Clostridia bacterium]
MNSILAVGVLVIAGFFGGLVAKKIRYPRISGYIIVGMLLSPSVLNVIPSQLIKEDLSVITDIALGVVAYLIGGSLSIERLKKLGKNIVTITPFQALGAWIFVTLLILSLSHFVIKFDISNPNFYQTYLPMAIIIGAISCATAPAAILAIIHEYRAKGTLTTTLLGVVALDDAFTIASYAVAISIAEVLIIGVEALSLYQMLIVPMFDVVGSLLLGAGFGFVLVYMSRFAKTRKTLLVIVLGTIMLSIGTAKILGISSLLANMAMGFVIVNKMRPSDKMFAVISDIEDVIFAMFFTLAGAHFDLGVVKTAGILALLIVIGRFSGKFIGARIGATISQAPTVVRKYLGFGLLPKAGVTMGLVLLAQQNSVFSVIGNMMVNAILASIIINELIAPPLTKYALFKAGEATSQ